MKSSTKLHEFAHDACVGGVSISFLCIVGSAVLRSEAPAAGSTSDGGGQPRSWIRAEWAPIELPARALRSQAKPARLVAGRRSELERPSVADAGLFAESAAELP